MVVHEPGAGSKIHIWDLNSVGFPTGPSRRVCVYLRPACASGNALEACHKTIFLDGRKGKRRVFGPGWTLLLALHLGKKMDIFFHRTPCRYVNIFTGMGVLYYYTTICNGIVVQYSKISIWFSLAALRILNIGNIGILGRRKEISCAPVGRIRRMSSSLKFAHHSPLSGPGHHRGPLWGTDLNGGVGTKGPGQNPASRGCISVHHPARLGKGGPEAGKWKCWRNGENCRHLLDCVSNPELNFVVVESKNWNPWGETEELEGFEMRVVVFSPLHSESGQETQSIEI